MIKRISINVYWPTCLNTLIKAHFDHNSARYCANRDHSGHWDHWVPIQHMTPDSSSLFWVTPSLPWSRICGSLLELAALSHVDPAAPRGRKLAKDADTALLRRKRVFVLQWVFLCEDKDWVWWWPGKKSVRGVTWWGTGEQPGCVSVPKILSSLWTDKKEDRVDAWRCVKWVNIWTWTQGKIK